MFLLFSTLIKKSEKNNNSKRERNSRKRSKNKRALIFDSPPHERQKRQRMIADRDIATVN